MNLGRYLHHVFKMEDLIKNCKYNEKNSSPFLVHHRSVIFFDHIGTFIYFFDDVIFKKPWNI